LEGEPNLLAWAALLLCPVVSIALVGMLRAQLAVPIIIFAGQMFLPPIAFFHIPHMPILDKDVLPAGSAMLACLIFRRKVLAGARPGRGYDLFIVTQIVGVLGTVLTNRDPVVFGPRVFQALEWFDFASSTNQIITFWFPVFILGRVIFRSRQDLEDLLIVMLIAGLVYTPFIFIEMRFSPQLNMWIYGYHQTSFEQTLRGSGYRPMVFMRHGLNLALFLVMTIIAGAVLVKNRRRVFGMPALPFVVYLIVVLLLCRSAGSIIYAAVAVPLIAFTSARIQIRWARVLAVLVFSYPLLRTLGLIPVETLVGLATSAFGALRADSMAFRLRQEALVMDRALQRIVFGWGGYSRPFMHDPITGDDRYIIDGFWVIQIATRGAVGFVAVFGMLCLPVWRAARTCARLSNRRDRAIVAGLALMVAFWAVDLIPNACIDAYLVFILGALAGTERFLRDAAPGPEAAQRPEVMAARDAPRYA
jgi:hypothetical protein